MIMREKNQKKISAHAHQRSLVTEFMLIRDFADAEVKTQQ